MEQVDHTILLGEACRAGQAPWCDGGLLAFAVAFLAVGIGAEIVAPPDATVVAVLLHRAAVDRAPARVSVRGVLRRWRGRWGASAVGRRPSAVGAGRGLGLLRGLDGRSALRFQGALGCWRMAVRVVWAALPPAARPAGARGSSLHTRPGPRPARAAAWSCDLAGPGRWYRAPCT